MKTLLRFRFIILAFIILFPTQAFAFFSPSTLSLWAAVLGPTCWSVLVVIAVNVIVFFKKVRKLYLCLSIFSLIFLLGMGSMYFHNYLLIKELNTPYDKVPLLKNEIDLNIVPMSELAQYKILSFLFKTPRWVDNESIPFNQADLRPLFFNFPQFEKDHADIMSPDKKYLVICENGDMSSYVANFLISKGYHHVFIARLSRTYRPEILNKYFRFKNPHPNSSLVIVPYQGQTNTVYLNFQISPKIIGLLKNAERIDPDKFTPDSIRDKNLVCLTNFDCLMDKYFLDYQGIKDERIYKITVPIDDYDSTKPLKN